MRVLATILGVALTSAPSASADEFPGTVWEYSNVYTIEQVVFPKVTYWVMPKDCINQLANEVPDWSKYRVIKQLGWACFIPFMAQFHEHPSKWEPFRKRLLSQAQTRRRISR